MQKGGNFCPNFGMPLKKGEIMSWFNALKLLSDNEHTIMKKGLLEPCCDCCLLKICDFNDKLYWAENLITQETIVKCDNFLKKEWKCEGCGGKFG